MRNPLDVTPVAPNVTHLDELSSVLAEVADRESAPADGVSDTPAPAQPTSAPASQPVVPMWETVIIRGGKIETKQFALPNAETPVDGGK